MNPIRGNLVSEVISQKISVPDYEILLKNVTLYDLAKAFKKAIDNIKPEVVHEIMRVNITVDEQVQYIFNKLEEYGELHFMSLVDGMKERIRIVITFIALLEMIKMQQIGVKESSDFNEFIIYKIEHGQNIQFNN